MNVSIELTPEEGRAAMVEVGRAINSAVLSARYRILRGFFTVLVWVLVGYLWRYFADAYGARASWLYLGSVLLVAVSILAIRWIDDFWVSRQIVSGTMTEPATYYFGQEGVEVDGGMVRSSIDWKAIKRVHEGDEFSLLFIDTAVPIIIPKRLPEERKIVSMALARGSESSID